MVPRSQMPFRWPPLQLAALWPLCQHLLGKLLGAYWGRGAPPNCSRAAPPGTEEKGRGAAAPRSNGSGASGDLGLHFSTDRTYIHEYMDIRPRLLHESEKMELKSLMRCSDRLVTLAEVPSPPPSSRRLSTQQRPPPAPHASPPAPRPRPECCLAVCRHHHDIPCCGRGCFHRYPHGHGCQEERAH